MEYIINNWPFIILLLSVVVIAIVAVINFFQKPTPQQIQQIQEWILYLVIEAERQFGSKMGKVKLRYVYDKFLERFDYLGKIISFEKFSELVDKALSTMKDMISQNDKLKEYVGIDQTPKLKEAKAEEETTSSPEK